MTPEWLHWKYVNEDGTESEDWARFEMFDRISYNKGEEYCQVFTKEKDEAWELSGSEAVAFSKSFVKAVSGQPPTPDEKVEALKEKMGYTTQ